MLKCACDAEATHLLFRAGEDLASAEAPEPITRAFMSATMTASANPTVEFVELQPGRHSVDWWPRLWPVSS